MTTMDTATMNIPDDIAKAAILPQSYRDEAAITYPAFAWLRMNNPLGRAVIEGYSPFWVVAKYNDLVAIERQPDVFVNNPGGLAALTVQTDAETEVMMSARGGKRVIDTLVMMDAPEHTAIKNVTSRWFLPAAVRKREDAIRALAKETVQTFLRTGGECDFVTDVALRFPLRVLMSLLGVPRSEEELFLTLTQDLFGAPDPDAQRPEFMNDPGAAARMFSAALADFYVYFDKLAADRRANPTDDLASVIANAKVDGQHLTSDFVNGYYLVLATAGHDTTSATIASTILELAKNPDQLAAVRSDMSLIPSMVDESLRWTSPVKHFLRVASEDIELGGRQIAKGDHLMLAYPSANRDEDVFDDPDTYNVRRKPNRQVAFGYGPHMCLGQHVAKIEMRILFEELLPHIESLELAGTPEYVATNFIGGLKSLPIRFGAA